MPRHGPCAWIPRAAKCAKHVEGAGLHGRQVALLPVLLEQVVQLALRALGSCRNDGAVGADAAASALAGARLAAGGRMWPPGMRAGLDACSGGPGTHGVPAAKRR